MIGRELGKYKLIREIGEGGMGTVYEGEHLQMGKKVAIKVLLSEYTQNPDVVRRFFNEAKAVGKVDHPGIVDIYDFEYDDDGTAYLIMELLRGSSLQTIIEENGILEEDRALDIVWQMASALDAAHSRGIIHRDLKPDNIYISPDPAATRGERVLVLDFGIAKLLDGQSAGPKTKTDMIMGTPAYMSPEQCKGAGNVDTRSDIYSVGCILYEILCQRPPFLGEGVGEIIGAHIYEIPPSPTELNKTISPQVEALITKMIEKNPAKRPQSMVELQAIVQTVMSSLQGATISVPASTSSSSATSFELEPTLPHRDFTPTPTPIPSRPRQSTKQSSPTTLEGTGALSVGAKYKKHRVIPRFWIVVAACIGLGAGITTVTLLVERNDEPQTLSDQIPPPEVEKSRARPTLKNNAQWIEKTKVQLQSLSSQACSCSDDNCFAVIETNHQKIVSAATKRLKDTNAPKEWLQLSLVELRRCDEVVANKAIALDPKSELPAAIKTKIQKLNNCAKAQNYRGIIEGTITPQVSKAPLVKITTKNIKTECFAEVLSGLRLPRRKPTPTHFRQRVDWKKAKKSIAPRN